MPNICYHIVNILKDKGLDENSVIKNYLITASDGKKYNVVCSHWRFLRKRKNKLLYAVTHNTAAEIASSSVDASKPNMGLTSWKGTKVLSFQSSSVLSIFLLIYFILMSYFTDYQLQRYKKCRNTTNNS